MKALGQGVLIITAGFLLILFFYWALNKGTNAAEVSQNVLFIQGEAKKIEKLTLIEPNTVEFSDGIYTYHTRVIVQDPRFLELINDLRKNGSVIKVIPASVSAFSMILIWGPTLLLVGVIIFSVRRQTRMASGGGNFGFGKSRAKLSSANDKKVTFADVAGVEEAKEELQEIVGFLKDPQKYTRLGGHIPKGLLLVGAPGTGKTLLAKAVSGEAGVPFFSIAGSDFVEMFVGVGASRVRDLFAEGKKSAPCIIFIDEIDSVGRHRAAGFGANDEKDQTLNQLLVEMDGFNAHIGVILIAATNRPDVLDSALLRPGRFDRRVVVDRPDVRGREAIVRVHAKLVPLGEDVDFSLIARETPGFVGADLENLVNEAALLAARKNKTMVDMSDFELAKDKVLMGSERKSLVLSLEERRNTAYHEAGHALVAKLLPGADPIHKVTIIPRGMALGLTQQVPIDDRHSYTKDFLENKLAILFGGRAAEELIFGNGNITTGAGNDLEKATEIVSKMVGEWGMSVNLPLMTFGKKSHEFLGGDFLQTKDCSNETASKIDKEKERFISEATKLAKDLLQKNKSALHDIASLLLERETISGADIDEILKNNTALK